MRPMPLLAALVFSAGGAACAPPAPGGAVGTAPVLYVLGGASAAGTVTVVGPASGRVLARVNVDAAPLLQPAAGPAGSLLALAGRREQPLALVQLRARDLPTPVQDVRGIARVSPLSPGGELAGGRRVWTGPWAARSLTVAGTGTGPVVQALLAADGGRYAAVAYRTAGAAIAGAGDGDAGQAAAACQLALVDLLDGAVVRLRQVCAGTERLGGLALEETATGPVAYLAVQTGPDRDTGLRAGRVIALRAGGDIAVVGVLPLAGVPLHLVLAPGPDRAGSRLYVVETQPDPGDAEDDLPLPATGHLVRVDATALEVEACAPLDYIPTQVAVSPDGATVYALVGHSLARLDVATGRQASLVSLPDRPIDLAVSDRSVFVAGVFAGKVWVIDRQRDRLVRTIPVAGWPVGLLFDPVSSSPSW